MLHDNFIKKLSLEESLEFKAIIDLLSSTNEHTREGRKLLNLLNHIIDFYIFRQLEDGDVKMPIIYFPLCEEWAQMLCEDFVTLKMSLLWGDTNRIAIDMYCKQNQHLTLPEKVTKKGKEALFQQFRFNHTIYKSLSQNIKGYSVGENEKCLLYSRFIYDQYTKKTIKKGHYHYSMDLVEDRIDTNKPIVLWGQSEDGLYKVIRKNKGKIQIPHFFLFLQKDLDGRNIDFGTSISRATINAYNEDYNLGIRNVFFFIFSQKPYRLQRIFENKRNLVERLQREKISQTRDFISFKKEEMDYVFNREGYNVEFLNFEYKDNVDFQQFKESFDLILQNIPHEVKLRNELAISFTDESLSKITSNILELDSDVNEDYIEYFISSFSKECKDKLLPKLQEWINNDNIAIVLDYNINEFYKKNLKSFLVSEFNVQNLSFYTFKDFRAYKQGSQFLNSIEENKILILSMLNHCTGKSWAIYPNSFDQYHLNPGQKVLQVNNKLVFDPRYSWYYYRYVEQLRLLLNSDFREKYIKNEIILPSKPTISEEPKEDEDEQNIHNRYFDREQRKIIVSFGGNQHRSFNEDEEVLCCINNELEMYSIADIYRIFDDISLLKIQPLVDFFDPLDVLVEQEVAKLEGELIIRRNPKYNLSEEEIESQREMWKILLEHQVKEKGDSCVYDEIMRFLLPIERIQFNSFRRWLDINNESILPRSRRMQKRVIEEYLGIDNLYVRLLRIRKSRTITNTEGKNRIFKTFLKNCLLETDIHKAYTSLSDEVLDYMNIEKERDIEIIVQLIKDEVLDLRQIKTIDYD